MDFKYKCPVCGEISMIPFEHIRGRIVCPLCSRKDGSMESRTISSTVRLDDTADFMGSLNPEQRAAAMYNGDARGVLVLAGAGCGKTRTMVARAVFLLGTKGVQPEKIAMLTFTRRAAAEVQERLEKELPGIGRRVFVGTFHRFCLSLIHRYSGYFRYSRLKILDAADQEQLISKIRSEIRYNGNKIGGREGILPNARHIASTFSLARNRRHEISNHLEKCHFQHDATAELILEVWNNYLEYKQKNEYLDFDDILSVVADKLAENEGFRKRVQDSLDYVLVDEMQDTSQVQWDIVKGLYPEVGLFCVGDDAQSIYGFRGADFEAVHHFCDRLPDSVTLKLTENYRSSQDILDVANALLALSPLEYGRVLHSSGARHGVVPRMFKCFDDDEEARSIVNSIKMKLMEGVPPKEIMVLLRSAYTGRMLEYCLNNNRIPYRMVGGIGFLQTAHVKDVISTFEALATLHNEMAWMRFLSLLPGIGLVTAVRLAAPAMNGGDRAEALMRIAASVEERCVKVKKSDDGQILKDAASFIRYMAVDVEAPGPYLGKIIEFYRRSPLLAQKYDNWNERLNDLDALGRIADRFSGVYEFLESFKLEPEDGRDETQDEDKITLITVHSAKGTEADICYVMRVQPGTFPHSRSSSAEEVEEERRILYVALTRARKELYLTRVDYMSRSWGAPMPKNCDFMEKDVLGHLKVL